MRIFINDRPIDADEGATVLSAVASADPELADQVREGAAYVTDARGIRMESDASLSAGSILRVVVSARRQEPDADA
jgi:hypothetical protein